MHDHRWEGGCPLGAKATIALNEWALAFPPPLCSYSLDLRGGSEHVRL